MPARVLTRNVPEWFGDQEPLARENLEKRCDPELSHGVESVSMVDLLRAGFGRPILCGLFLELPYKSSRPTRKALLEAVPWLELLRDKETLLTNLRHRGWLLFRCPSRGRAAELQAQVRGSLLRCTVLGSTDMESP